MASPAVPTAPTGEQNNTTERNLSVSRSGRGAVQVNREDDGAPQTRHKKLTLLVLLGDEVPEDTPPTTTAPESISKVVFPRFMQYIQKKYPDTVQVIAGTSLDCFLPPRHKAALQNAEALFVLTAKVEAVRELLRHVGPQLRWIHNYTAGVSSLTDVLRQTPWPVCLSQTWASQPHVLVTNGRTVFSRPLAEYVFAAVLHFYKQIPIFQKLQRRCAWSQIPLLQLRGKTMGFLGFGDIGRECARLAMAFDMRCTALRSGRSASSNEGIVLDRVWTQKCSDRLEFYRSADIVVCSLPATAETENCVGAAEFAAMKKSSIFISIGRGSVVDEGALLSAVQTDCIAGAALDVFREEPLPADSPLWKEERILISCHSCDCVEDHSAAATIGVFDENLRRFLAGARNNSDMYTPVDVNRGY